ncbi:hypothetical protein [Nocardia sp. alder85J]|uniref:hypothetical protein n=1 Tax=Nocardia sp. alder85J TaxID=2862949 RepID=UPI001CD790A5|nr:hypothetical protein [Nocardia sp. alder85J]MCX4097757.1 hypothetical protein [Nocardia sp. alder85J]
MMDATTAREVRDRIQPLYEQVVAALGREHPSAVALDQAARSLPAHMPRRYADHEPH